MGEGVAVIDETTLEGTALNGAALQDGSLLEGDQYIIDEQNFVELHS